jgi:hypothetical protein
MRLNQVVASVFGGIKGGIAVAVAGFLTVGAASAAVINYGNFPVPPSGITFQNVTESSGTDAVPLYGPPSPFVTGLDFNPTTFVSSATNGAIDVTDGQLNFTIKGVVVSPGNGAGVNGFSITEGGDFSLLGVGTNATQALAGVSIHATVTEIDGVPVAPIVLTPQNASVGFNLVSNPGLLQPWSLGTGFGNIDAQLTAAGKTFTIGATKVDVVIDDSLNALSQAGSSAFIAKKDFVLTTDTDISGVLPEPTSAVVAGLFLCGFASRRRARA